MTRPRAGTLLVLLAPALVVMTLAGLLPLAIVVFYSLHDTFSGNGFIWVGGQWFGQVLTSPEFRDALLRSLLFSGLALAIEVPLGLWIALRLPPSGRLTAVLIVLAAIPLLTPAIAVGYLWKAMTLPGIGPVAALANALGIAFDMNGAVSTWAALLMMDAWHWTSLVVLLCFAGLRGIPDAYYRAARIDGAGRWAVFRHIQLPKLKTVLAIAVMLRFMDSFMIYAEAYVMTRGGPGVSTTFLSHELVQTAIIQFDLGEGGAMAVIYLLIALAVSWAFFRILTSRDLEGASA